MAEDTKSPQPPGQQLLNLNAFPEGTTLGVFGDVFNPDKIKGPAALIRQHPPNLGTFGKFSKVWKFVEMMKRTVPSPGSIGGVFHGKIGQGGLIDRHVTQGSWHRIHHRDG